MKITKKDNKVIVELDLKQKGEYTYGCGEWEMPNLIGVIAGNEKTISQLNYLDYKDDLQEGMPLIYFNCSEKEFVEKCKELGIDVWKHQVCSECEKVLYGSFTYGDK